MSLHINPIGSSVLIYFKTLFILIVNIIPQNFTKEVIKWKN
jgi:hypothetical protein